jgi:geranylgeranylglycerol-phosphate geranylgeranyltransferase
MKRAAALLELTRPVNNLITLVAVYLGAIISVDFYFSLEMLLASLSGMLISAGGNVINDYFDLEVDRASKPHRPLPSGRVTSTGALSFYLFLSTIGLILSALVNRSAFIIAGAAVVGLFFYSASLKLELFWGNFTVAFISALAFLYGGVSVRNPGGALIPAVFAFLYHFGREVLKDLEDMEADRLRRSRSIPLVLGEKPAQRITALSFFLLTVATVVPFATKVYGWIYLVVVVFGVDLLLVYIVSSMLRDTTAANLSRLSRLLKIGMVIGIVAVFLGSRGL